MLMRMIAYKYNEGDMNEMVICGEKLKIGDRIRVVSQWPYMRTPKWAAGYKGTIVRFNKYTISVKLDDFPNEICRIDYGDWEKIDM